MEVAKDVLELIGKTPIVKLNSFDTGKCSLYVKLEYQNPGGSIKDRMALSMIKAAEDSGVLKPGGTIVEATSGNTGIALALVAVLKGYRLIVVYPDKFSKEKALHLQAMGAEIVPTRSDVNPGHPEHYDDLASAIAKRENAYYVNQFGNPANPLAHETTTAPEIWEQMKKHVDAVVCGVGSAGTITGLSRFFKKTAPQVEIILADPVGSVLAEYINTGILPKEAGSWAVEGIGEDYIPPVADLSHVKKAYSISDTEAFETARKMLKKEGIFSGPSTGVLVAAALRYCQEQDRPKNVVTFACDTGNKYLSKMYSDYWMMDHGFIKKQGKGNLGDYISHRFDEGATVVVGPEDTLATVIARMKLYDISQIPVIKDNKIVGIVDESDLLLALFSKKSNLKSVISEVMNTTLEKVPSSASLEDLIPIFKKGYVAIVEDQGKFVGLITQMDMINHLRQSLKLQ